MATLKDEAKNYRPAITLNITDLDRVSLTFPVVDREGKDKDGEPFYYKAMIVNGMEYRVPNSVLEKIQEMLELKPDLEFIQVTKTGTGLGTRYSVRKVN